MIHTGSRGLGHQVCSDYLMMMKSAKQPIALNDRQLMCAPIKSQIGQKYLVRIGSTLNVSSPRPNSRLSLRWRVPAISRSRTGRQ